ncbi:hypothetical protein [Halovivax gelatinilyticus]|uniref:hypothetical protein n=1 Tax=Halovivax gelatinilyticus TaxID=2961597 RepID=UPI0020CA7242|nr:hypothetical protein [Halovivax gelatinilyticus]
MTALGRVRPHVLGERRDVGRFLLGVIGLLALLSGGFALGVLDVGYTPGWIGLAIGIAIAGRVVKAGLAPTIGAVWLVALLLHAFPPLVGHLTGDWEMASRYTYPRRLGYGYTDAYHELIGGIERGATAGLPFAIVVGAGGYGIATVVARYSRRSTTR